jgi:hypothetical protein
MEPVFRALGEACGIAAKKQWGTKTELLTVDVPAVQKEMLKRGSVILYEAQPLRPDRLCSVLEDITFVKNSLSKIA